MIHWRQTLVIYLLPRMPPSHYLKPTSLHVTLCRHQPELLLLQWMLHMLEGLIESILQHPLVLDPIPSRQHFTDHNSYRLFVQFRNALHRLAPLRLDLTQGRRLLQFLPGSPGSHRHCYHRSTFFFNHHLPSSRTIAHAVESATPRPVHGTLHFFIAATLLLLLPLTRHPLDQKPAATSTTPMH